MKRKDSRRRIRVFYGILIIPTVLWALLSLVGIARHLDYDTGEKRNKHVMAEDTNLSNLTTELEACYNDRVPFRSLMLSVNSSLNWILELPYTKVIEPALIHLANASMDQTDSQNQVATNLPEQAEGQPEENAPQMAVTNPDDSAMAPDNPEAMDSAQNPEGENADSMQENPAETQNTLPILPPYYESPVEAGYYPYKELAAEVIQGRDNWLFTGESYPDYIGANLPDESEMAYKVSRMEALDQLCQSRGIEFHIAAMPNKCTVYPEYMPSVEQAQISAVNMLEEYVHTHSSVSFHYLDDAMLGAKVYGQLYYKHDTHWNNRGGLAASAYLRNILGLPPIDIGSVSSRELEPFYGDLALYSGLPAASFEDENAVEMEYKQEIPQQLVQGGDDYIDEVVSQNTEREQTLVLVGDSYRHSLLPYLSRDFAHVYFISEVKLNPEIAEIISGADILLLEGVERNFFSLTNYDDAVEDLIALLS